MTINVGVITPQGTETIAEVDQQTLEVIKSGTLKTLEWEIIMDGDDTILAAQTLNNPDGCRYRLLIEVLDWWNATGEGYKKYVLNTASFSGFEDLDCSEFETMELAIEAIVTRKEELRRSNEIPEKMLEEVKPSTCVEDEEIPTYMVSLYIVPVSVPRDVLSKACGCGTDNLDDMADECFKKNGDFRDFVWDLHSYGTHVPIRIKGCFGVKCKEEELERVTQMAKDQAEPIPQLFGFYMSQPWNAVGWDGWYVFKEAKAFPSMHDEKLPESHLERQRCNDCGETRDAQKYRTIYDGEGVWICEVCLDDWYQCKCGVLVPVQPQSWAGVEWVDINHIKYCSSCATKLINSKECPRAIPGGTVMSIQDVGRMATDLSNVQLDEDTWQHGDKEGLPFEWCLHWDDSETQPSIAKKIAEIVERATPDEEFLFGSVSHEQFAHTIGLYWRKKQ